MPGAGHGQEVPTALLNSAIAVDFKQAQAAILAVECPGSMAASPESREKFIDLIETYFERGGRYLQFSIMDVQTLIDPKKHPRSTARSWSGSAAIAPTSLR